MTTLCPPVREVGRDAVRRWDHELDAWLLPEAGFSAAHTWPQLYRSDGQGRFFVVADGDTLLAHCATRQVTLHGERGAVPVCLLGSVVTNPSHRGRGLASQVLAAAIAANAAATAATLLWAERAGLYARAGFVPSVGETCLLLARRPHPRRDGVRPATVADLAFLHALHQAKSWRVDRSATTMATLLSTPGMTTLVLERGGAVVAYACCGKGADLYGHWHELGGSDADLADLLPAALHVCEQTEAPLLLPPYRHELRERLGRSVIDAQPIPGPMVRAPHGPLGGFWIDGLDSV
ncbi:MAG: GNAT family N-acetyltransferase [Planctomycetes bacterium]|nr:GNAT family N-acetyltransferase [Planctomycetota bacterium]